VETSQDLGSVKEILGKLWKSVDAMKISASADSGKISEKLDVWIDTNRVILQSNQRLLEVILQNSQEVQRSTRSYEQGSQLFTQLQQQLESLKAATIELSETLEFSPPVAAVVEDSQPQNDRANLSKLQDLQDGLSQALSNLQGLQSLFSASVEAQIKKLNDWSQENEKSLPQTATWRDKLSPWMLAVGAIAAIALVGSGVAIAITIPKFAQAESDRARWANTTEGQLAWNIMQWNNAKLGNMECLNDVKRLNVTLKVDGRPATSGFCTLWVVPAEKRTFEE
jgi:hypothetical protein